MHSANYSAILTIVLSDPDLPVSFEIGMPSTGESGCLYMLARDKVKIAARSPCNLQSQSISSHLYSTLQESVTQGGGSEFTSQQPWPFRYLTISKICSRPLTEKNDLHSSSGIQKALHLAKKSAYERIVSDHDLTVNQPDFCTKLTSSS
jgi:hypothetical protein